MSKESFRDKIRKALGKTQIHKIKEYRKKFVEGAVERGCIDSVADSLWSTLEKFAKYCFNRSHALAYSITGYISQWFKANYPVYYWTVAFSYSQEEDIPYYISEINKIGMISVKSVSINKSIRNFTSDFTNNSIYWSLSSIKHCGEKAVDEILQERERNGEYFSLEDFLSRHSFKGSKVNKRVIENLVLSGSFDELESIKQLVKRLDLIKKVRSFKKTAEDGDGWFEEATKNGNIYEPWWWTLQQKYISGYALFDYEGLLNSAGLINYKYKSVSIDELQLKSSQKLKVCIGGYIQEIVVRVSKKREEYATIIIESNYDFLTITVWPDIWSSISKMFERAEKKIVLFQGEVVYDGYRKMNVINFCSDSEILILE
jgi:DNA polymerase-3 subunit alpha